MKRKKNLIYCKYCSNIDNPDKCLLCDGDLNFKSQKQYLSVQSIIKNQYIIDKVIFVNSEGVTYIAYDKENNKKYFIREYLPLNICKRFSDNNYVIPKQKKEAQYKALMIDFIDIHKILSKLQIQTGIIPIKEIWAENNTVYIIKEYIELLSLKKFIDKQPNHCLSWYQCKPIFFKLNNILLNIHNKGLIHRGVSPYNIFFDKSANVYIDGFSISCVRTANSELECELYKGFSAPEQYQTNGWQDTWTDVYSLAATLYYVLTGQTLSSDENDILKNNSMMPDEIMSAIMGATKTNYKERTKNLNQFYIELTDEIFQSNTTVYDTSNLKNITTISKGDDKMKKNNIYKNIIIISSIIFVIILGVVCINIINTLKGGTKTKKIDEEYIEKNAWLFDDTSVNSQNDNENKNNEIGKSDNKVDKMKNISTLPNFVGEQIDDIKNDESYNKKLKFIIEEEYSESNSGEIIHQDPSPGVSLKKNKLDVTLKVSKGPEYIEIPDILNKPIDEAKEALDELQIKYHIVEVYDKNYKSGVINSMNKNPGEKIIKNKDTLILRIKSSKLNEPQQENIQNEQQFNNINNIQETTELGKTDNINNTEQTPNVNKNSEQTDSEYITEQ